MKIKKIVIVGGGTAGWLTAHQFLNKSSPFLKVTVISAPDIPIIGVGESTTGLFRDLINLPNNRTFLDEKSFLKETESTFKLGIKHSDWHTLGKHFYSPLGDEYSNKYLYPHKDYDNFRIFHVAEQLDYSETFQSQLMHHCRMHMGPSHNFDNAFNFAYHLDTYKVGQYLRERALRVKEQCAHIEEKVVDVKQNEKGFVTSVLTQTGQEIEGDFFIDCSGFKRILIGKLCNKFISYADELLVNRALTFEIPYQKESFIRNYTHAWAQKNGWLWQIPTQTRLGCGYVYCDHDYNPAQAREEIEKKLAQKIKPIKDLKFTTGRMEKMWIKNVMSLGLASSFIEPLEATSIHATCFQTTHFIENYFKEEMPFECELLHQQYNYAITQMYDQIKDFIVFHYISPRKDTVFWQEASSPKRWSDALKHKLELWKIRMPRMVDYTFSHSNNYSLGNTLWYQIGLGMKLFNPKLAKQELMEYGLYYDTRKDYEEMKIKLKKVLPQLYLTNDYYASL
jgi:hypothetical protein